MAVKYNSYDNYVVVPKLPTYKPPYRPQQNTDPSAYYTKALGFLPIDTRYMVNTTNNLAYNSMADVLFNKAAQEKRWANTPWMQGVLNPLRIVADTFLLSKDTVIDPMVQGAIDDGFKGLMRGGSTALVNSLVNLGNTLDIVSNPIKGLVLEGGDGFVKGLVGDEHGRKQYDYNEYIDTGVGVADFILSLAAEIVSDPLNWISFGGKAAVKAGADTAADGVIKSIKTALKEALDRGVKSVDDLVPELTKAASYMSEDTARSLLKQMASESGEVTEAAMKATMDDFTAGLAKGITRVGYEGGTETAFKNLAGDLATGKTTRMKTGLFDVTPVKVTPAMQMGVSEYLNYAAKNTPDIISKGGLKAIKISDTIQKGLFNVAGLTGLDWFVGGNKAINYVSDALKGRHAARSQTIIKTISDLDKDLRIDVSSLDKNAFPDLMEVDFKALANTDHDSIARSLNALKDKFSARTLDAKKAGTLNKATYIKIRTEILTEMDDVIKQGTKSISNLQSLTEYLDFFKQLRSVSKTEVSALDNIIEQLDAFNNLFTKQVDDSVFKDVDLALAQYQKLVDEVFTSTQSENIAKTVDTETKIKTVKTAARESLDKLRAQAERIAARNAQITNSIEYILQQHQDLIKSKLTLDDALKQFDSTGRATVLFDTDYTAYKNAYENYFDVIHDSTKTSSEIQQAQLDLINAYNKLEESYEVNVLSSLKRAARDSQDAAYKATNKDVQDFFKSLKQQHIDEVDELIDLRDYVTGGLISYTLMTQQTKFVTDLLGYSLDGKPLTKIGPLKVLLDDYNSGGALYEFLNNKNVKPNSIEGTRIAAARNLLARFDVFQNLCYSINDMCVKAGLDIGHRQGLLDSLVTELQRGTLNPSTNLHTMAKRMVDSAEVYVANHIAGKSFSMDTVLREVATEVFEKSNSGDTKQIAKEILNSLDNAHDGAVDVDNWLRLIQISKDSDDPILKGISEKLRETAKGRRIITFDLEALGAKELHNTPYQIAGKILDDTGNVVEAFNIYIRPKQGMRPLDSVLRKLAPSSVASDTASLHKWWSSLWEEGSTVLQGSVVDSAEQGVRMFQDICAKYSDQGFIFAGQNIKSFDIDLLAKYAGNDFKDILRQTDVFDSLEYLTINNRFKLQGDMRTIFISELELMLKNDLLAVSSIFKNTKLFTSQDIITLSELKQAFKGDPSLKDFSSVLDDISKQWYSPPDFNATKYFTVSKIDPKTYSPIVKAHIDNLIAQGLINVTGTSNIQNFLNKGVAFDTVNLNFKTAVSLELANIFSLDKMASPIVTRGVAEDLTLHARNILHKRIGLTNAMIEKLLPEARKILEVLQDDAALVKLGINTDNSLYTYAKYLYDNADNATVVATALYYGSKNDALNQMFKQDPLTILRLQDLDEATNLPRFIFEEDYYRYEDFINVIESDDPFKLIKAYNTEHNIHSIHAAAMHRMQADQVGLLKKVRATLAHLSGGSDKAYKHLERTVYSYSDYLDEQHIKEILNRPNRVQSFISEAKLRAGRVYFETRDAIDLSDFANTEGVIAKSIERFDEVTGKSLGYAHVICLTKETYNSVDDIVCGIKMVSSVKDMPRELYNLVKENRYNNGLYVKNIGWSHGDVLTKKHIWCFDEMLKNDFDINADVLVDTNTLVSQKYFQMTRANNMIIGNREVFERVLKNSDTMYVADPFKLTFYNTKSAISAKHTKLATYLNLFFNPENRIGSAIFDTNKLSNSELYKLSKEHKGDGGWFYLEKPHIKEGSFVSHFFSDHTESGYVMREIPIINEHSIDVVKQVGAYWIPRAQAGQLMEAINTFQLPPIAEFARSISTIYKIAYLGSVGVVIRNCIDSNYKTRWALNGTVSMPAQIKHLFGTMKLIKDYDEIGQVYTSVVKDYFATDLDYELFYKTVKHIDDTDVVTKVASEYSAEMTERVTRKVNNILKQFSNNMDDLKSIQTKLIDPDMFSVMDSFLRYGPSAGLSKSVVDNIMIKTSDDAATHKLITLLTEKTPMRFVYGMNDMVERSARLSMFLQDVSRGSSINDAINNILKTHFDYSDKSLGMLYAEIIFPFMNFSYKNLDFWIESVYKNPALVGELENIFRTVLDYQGLFEDDQEAYEAYDYTFDWSEHVTSFKANAPWTMINAARLYHILNGNILIKHGDTVMHDSGYGEKANELYTVFKLSPSFLDAVKMLYNPLNSYSERMLPPYETVLNIFKGMANGESVVEKMNTASLVNILPYGDVVMQRLGIDEKGLRHNNIWKRIEDAGPHQALGSLFGTAYVPIKDNYYWYDSDYNILGGFKTNYYAKRNYSNPYNSKYPTYTLTRMAQNKKPRNIYAKSKTNRIYNQQYNNVVRGITYKGLRYRLKDYNHYY